MISWDLAARIIASRDFIKLVRSPEQAAQYARAKLQFLSSHGGTAEYVIKERLQWTGSALKASGSPFLQNKQDYRVLLNDFSYDFEAGIDHFVVFSKALIPCDASEFPTAEASDAISSFLQQEFTEKLKIPRDDLLWFKNTGALQSIPEVSHFHVLVRHCTPELREQILKIPSSV